jgi:hypothetical protein
MYSKNDEDWTEDDSVVAQAIADYLGAEVLGFSPRSIASSDDFHSVIHIPKLDIEIFRNNVPILQSIVLSAFLHGTEIERNHIAQAIKPENFWNKSFRKYLFEVMLDQYQKTNQISIEETQGSIPEHAVLVYGESPTKRDLFGDYYTWVQILKFNPTWQQVLESIERILR